MEPTFDFRTDRYNFWPVYEAIKKYYPLGLSRTEGSIFFDYHGLKRLEEIVVENIHNESAFKEKWEDPTQKWQEEFKLNIVGTTFGQAPSFSSCIEIKNVKFEGRVLTEELHFSVSITGPFFTIFGIDRTTLEDDGFYRQTHRTIISPYAGYSQLFVKLREKIEGLFPGYYFVPYSIHAMFMDGLRVWYRNDEKNRIYHALFNEMFEFAAPVVGDECNYGFEQWFKESPNIKEGEWTVYPPGYSGSL